MPAAKKHGQETQARAVRMYAERLAEGDVSQLKARQEVGELRSGPVRPVERHPSLMSNGHDGEGVLARVVHDAIVGARDLRLAEGVPRIGCGHGRCRLGPIQATVNDTVEIRPKLGTPQTSTAVVPLDCVAQFLDRIRVNPEGEAHADSAAARESRYEFASSRVSGLTAPLSISVAR